MLLCGVQCTKSENKLQGPLPGGVLDFHFGIGVRPEGAQMGA